MKCMIFFPSQNVWGGGDQIFCFPPPTAKSGGHVSPPPVPHQMMLINNTYHGLCYTSGALARMRNGSDRCSVECNIFNSLVVLKHYKYSTLDRFASLLSLPSTNGVNKLRFILGLRYQDHTENKVGVLYY